MMPANQTEIQAFLKKISFESEIAPATINKAGLLPFIGENPREYYVMTPIAARPELGLPEFQMCKGTRLWQNASGDWVDMRGIVPDGATLEPIAETALREGMEELGLVLDNIEALFSLGVYTFSSAATHAPKTMWLFAAKMHDKDDFLAQEHVAKTTAERAWMSYSAFFKQGRADHTHILSLIENNRQI